MLSPTFSSSTLCVDVPALDIIVQFSRRLFFLVDRRRLCTVHIAIPSLAYRNPVSKDHLLDYPSCRALVRENPRKKKFVFFSVPLIFVSPLPSTEPFIPPGALLNVGVPGG